MATFYLNNGEAKNEPKVYNNRLLPFCPTPSYLGIKLDRTKAIFARLTSEATYKLKMVANTKILRTDALSLTHRCPDYTHMNIAHRCPLSTQHLGTEHQSGVAALGLALRTVS